MIKKIFSLLLTATMGLLFVACNPSKSALTDLEKFANRMEQKSDSWSPAEWDDAAVQFSEITETIKRYEYTDEELRYIGRLEGRCGALFVAHTAGQAVDILHDASMEFEGILNGFMDVFGNE